MGDPKSAIMDYFRLLTDVLDVSIIVLVYYYTYTDMPAPNYKTTYPVSRDSPTIIAVTPVS